MGSASCVIRDRESGPVDCTGERSSPWSTLTCKVVSAREGMDVLAYGLLRLVREEPP